MRDSGSDKAYLSRQLAANGWRFIVPITGKVDWWSDRSGSPQVEFHQAELDFSKETVQLTTTLLSFNDVRQLFYAMVAGEEVT